MRVLLIDNSKPHLARYTPKLRALLARHATVTVCATVDETTRALTERWDAIVLSGSSLNVTDTLRANAIAKDLMVLLRKPDVPVLGVCFGMQLMAVAYGGDVDRLPRHREGLVRVVPETSTGTGGMAHFSHQDAVCAVPPGFSVDAVTDDGIIAEMRSTALRRHGVQYHPEASPAETKRVVYDFLNAAWQCRVHIGGERVSSTEYAHTVVLMGRTSPQNTAARVGIARRTVEAIWDDFRRKYRIPAVMV